MDEHGWMKSGPNPAGKRALVVCEELVECCCFGLVLLAAGVVFFCWSSVVFAVSFVREVSLFENGAIRAGSKLLRFSRALVLGF